MLLMARNIRRTVMMNIGMRLTVSLAVVCALWMGEVAAQQSTKAANISSSHQSAQPTSAKPCCQHPECRCG
jgi:hypothetical protein